jgi:hypothetical protein
VLLPFSWKIPGRTVWLVVTALEVEVEVEVEEGVVEVVDVDVGVVEVEVDVGVGVGVGVGVSLVVVGSSEVDGGGATLDEGASSSSPPPSPPPGPKATMLAVLPLETVTTQKDEPPAPVAASEEMTLPPWPISQGNPVQPPSGHSTRRPHSGALPVSDEPSQMGFQPTLTKV